MRILKPVRSAVLICAVLSSTAVASAAPRNRDTLSDDARIQVTVARQLSDLDRTSSPVNITVHDGVVTLSGTVPSLWLKQEAIKRAQKVDDVKTVVADLAIRRGESDEAIASEVTNRIQQYALLTVYDDVEGAVHDGVVTLTGKVTMPFKASDLSDLVARVPGVQEVHNDIATLPLSTFDDHLRVAIASKIYRDPLFWNYAMQVNPPIHVVVEHGHVTLTGVINSEVERRKAEAVARETAGVFSVDNKLRLDRAPRSPR
jgi:osmotically-inducible protein OsmY